MKRKSVAVLPGDGIGPEVLDAALPVLDVLGVPIDLKFGDIGWECWKTEGSPVPDRTWNLINQTDAVLLGATTSKPAREAYDELAPSLREQSPDYTSPIIQLRQRLDLYANLRPVESFLGGGTPYRFCIVRENTEGLYAGLDFTDLPDQLWPLVKDHPNVGLSSDQAASATIRLQTSHGVERILRFAFETARQHNYGRVTLADKPNVLRRSSAFVRQHLEVVAADYPEIEHEILNVDAVALWMVRRPERFGVIVAENMFGDILSDLGAGVMGGLGLAPSGNFGQNGSYFEPVHGSAPGMAGQQRANPAATILTIGMLLQHLGFHDASENLGEAVRDVVRRRDRLTYDLGGAATTKSSARAVIQSCAKTKDRSNRTATVITVGDELLRGDILDANSAATSKSLLDYGVSTRQQQSVGDDEAAICDAVRSSLGRDDFIFVIGGLGPTSDDVTRSAVAKSVSSPLVLREEAWQAVVDRLVRFGVSVHEDNQRQAQFPENAELIPNSNGTAWGCYVRTGSTVVVMLPGPPKECQPMLEAVLSDQLCQPIPQSNALLFRRTLGLIEADAAALVDQAMNGSGIRANKPSYRWHYPFVDIRIECSLESTENLASVLDTVLEGHIVTDRERTATEELGVLLGQLDIGLEIDDKLTGGAFSRDVGNHSQNLQQRSIRVELVGSWSHDPADYTGTVTARCTIHRTNLDPITRELTIPNRGPEVIEYFSQFAAWTINHHLTKGRS